MRPVIKLDAEQSELRQSTDLKRKLKMSDNKLKVISYKNRISNAYKSLLINRLINENKSLKKENFNFNQNLNRYKDFIVDLKELCAKYNNLEANENSIVSFGQNSTQSINPNKLKSNQNVIKVTSTQISTEKPISSSEPIQNTSSSQVSEEVVLVEDETVSDRTPISSNQNDSLSENLSIILIETELNQIDQQLVNSRKPYTRRCRKADKENQTTVGKRRVKKAVVLKFTN